MAKGANVAARKEAETTDPIRQLACVVAIYALREVPAEDAAIRLDQIGFSPKEIAGILGKNDNYVHMIKSARKRKK
jgi:hypothetical protein